MRRPESGGARITHRTGIPFWRLRGSKKSTRGITKRHRGAFGGSKQTTVRQVRVLLNMACQTILRIRPFLPAKRHFGDSGIPAGAFRGFQNRFWAIRNRPGSVLSQSHTDKRHFADFWDPGRRQKGPPDAFGIPAAPRNPQFERSFLDRPFNPRIPKPFGGSGAGNESAGERFGIPRICRGAFRDPRGRRKRPRDFPESRFRHFGGPGSPI